MDRERSEFEAWVPVTVPWAAGIRHIFLKLNDETGLVDASLGADQFTMNAEAIEQLGQFCHDVLLRAGEA